MPHTVSTVRTLPRELSVTGGESVEDAMRRVDQAETDAICRHLLGELLAGGRLAHTASEAGRR